MSASFRRFQEFQGPFQLWKKDFILVTPQCSDFDGKTFLETLTHLFPMHPLEKG